MSQTETDWSTDCEVLLQRHNYAFQGSNSHTSPSEYNYCLYLPVAHLLLVCLAEASSLGKDDSLPETPNYPEICREREK